MSSTIAPGDAIALTRALTQIDSRNPTLAPGAPGEGAIAAFLDGVLREWGFSTELQDAVAGRPNLIARMGPSDAPALMFAGHLDTVGVEGMVHSPFDASIENESIYGRGSADMKAGVASMCAAAYLATKSIDDAGERQIVIAAVADEEYESLGMRALLDSGVRADMAILTEPTRLAICPAHRGFVWTEVTFTGRAAHGSRYDIGVDAIMHAGLVLAELDRLEADVLPAKTHALLGRASLHASVIEGGIGLSTYPDRCVLSIERRTLPGENDDDALREITDACDSVKSRRPELSVSVKVVGAQAPSDVKADAPVVRALERVMRKQDLPVAIEGLSAWTDAALLNEAGIPAICFGPGDIALAHAAEEFVPLRDITRATSVLTEVARDWLLGET
ncbi:MAG TPA: ArgE/DapE family deacylase [Gemmatimonadaceae bacterium]|nr:ArgE/DapE family deacylase [Gemmatimonadaceae bacterium]